MRGGTDLGFLMKIRDERVKNGQRVFKIKVYGADKKADIAGFGQVDMEGQLAAVRRLLEIVKCATRTHTQRERERERERVNTPYHTHTHTHTH